MTERDAFELRLGAAIHGYAGRATSDLDALELAHRIATSRPRRRGFAAALTWRGLAIPRTAWILLLLAALLTAVVAGMLVVGSQVQRSLPAIVPAFACPTGTNPDTPGPVDQARPETLFWTPHMAFDRRAGRLVAVTGDAYGPAAPETWTFDVCTNTWTRMHPNREPPGFVHSYLVYDVDSDVTIGVPHRDGEPGNVWAYDLQTDTWTEQGVAQGEPRFYDPVTGLVVAGGEDGLLAYDVETDTWTPIHQANGGPDHVGLVAYDASVDRMIAVYDSDAAAGVTPKSAVVDRGSFGTWLFDLRTGTWSRSGVDTPIFIEGFWAVPAVAYDEAAERVVFLGNAHWAGYDAAADRWEELARPGGFAGPTVYDPVNRRLIGLRLGGEAVAGDVVAFALATREWTVLLEPSEGRPAP